MFSLQDPYSFYRAVRPGASVPRIGPYRVLIDFLEVQAAFRDPACETAPLRTMVAEVEKAEKDSGHRLPALREALDGMLVFDGPPGHAQRRRYLARAINSRSLTPFQPQTEALASALMAGLDFHAGADLIGGFANTFPHRVINSWFGFPEEELPFLVDCAEGVFVPLVGQICSAAQLIEMNSRAAMGLDLVESAIRERRQNPRDDGLSRMVAFAEPDATDRILAARCYFLFLVSTETMRNFLGSAFWQLLNHPPEADRVRRGEVTIEAAMEELIRFESPVHATFRICTQARRFGATTLKAGEIFIVGIGAAHRDPQVFPHPDVLKLDRGGSPSIAFAEGAHACLGAALARMQGHAALKAFFQLPPLQSDGNIIWQGNPTMRRIDKLMVSYR